MMKIYIFIRGKMKKKFGNYLTLRSIKQLRRNELLRIRQNKVPSYLRRLILQKKEPELDVGILEGVTKKMTLALNEGRSVLIK
jgi:hypothetical protein